MKKIARIGLNLGVMIGIVVFVLKWTAVPIVLGIPLPSFAADDMSPRGTFHEGLLLRATKTANVDGEVVRLNVSLSRNMMPYGAPLIGKQPPADRSALVATVRIQRTGLPPIEASSHTDEGMAEHLARHWELTPDNYSIDAVWLIANDEVWSPPLQPADYYGPAFRAWSGPEWNDQTIVDVIARVIDDDGREHLLVARDQRVTLCD